jgi:hypothetical protein
LLHPKIPQSKVQGFTSRDVYIVYIAPYVIYSAYQSCHWSPGTSLLHLVPLHPIDWERTALMKECYPTHLHHIPQKPCENHILR